MKRVYAYETGDVLDGAPSAQLVGESEAELSGTGAVAAYLDERNVWQHVPDALVEFVERFRGEAVLTVYVLD